MVALPKDRFRRYRYKSYLFILFQIYYADGYAIAYAVLQYFSSHVPACVLFSTHYHTLVEELKDTRNIGLYHMDCYLDEELSFLYTVQPGMAHNSFGLHVAKMAGLPQSILREAERKSNVEGKKRQRIMKRRLLQLVMDLGQQVEDARRESYEREERGDDDGHVSNRYTDCLHAMDMIWRQAKIASQTGSCH